MAAPSAAAAAAVDEQKVRAFVDAEFEKTVVPALCRYIEVPNQSPLFDAEWASNGLLDRAMDVLVQWVKAQEVPGLTYQLLKDDGRTPFLCIEIEATERSSEQPLLMYAHMDKQPPMTEFWSEGLGPWKPVVRDGKLYGRGGADDGYGVFAAVLAVKALRLQGVPHARVVIVIEGSEESGSPDLSYYLGKLKETIGTPGVLVCLDSGCGDYERMWLTTSLRGLTVGTLRVRGTTKGVHSGASSGVVVSTARVMRQLLDRLEDSKTGVLIDALQVEVPAQHMEFARRTGTTLGAEVHRQFPLIDGARPAAEDPVELMLNKTWRPTLCVTGVDGIPDLGSAGNVMRTDTAFKLSIRLPPTANSAECAAAVKKLLESDTPYGYSATFTVEKASNGWASPPVSPWLADALDKASRAYFGGNPVGHIGEGGSVPFVGQIGRQFPGIDFVVTGVLGPNSSAHGPDEFLHLAQARGVTCAIANIVAAHHKQTFAEPAKRQRTD